MLYGKPSVDGAISFISKGIAKLEDAISHHANIAARELENKRNAEYAHKAASSEVERAKAVKAKLEALIG